MPDEVYERYKRNPRNFRLLAAYGRYQDEVLEKQRKKGESEAKKPKGK